jgi:hypothetical protein
VDVPAYVAPPIMFHIAGSVIEEEVNFGEHDALTHVSLFEYFQYALPKICQCMLLSNKFISLGVDM